MIEAKNVSKSFGDHLVLDNISVKFDKGKTNLIIGQSGSGKTVLMKCLIGLYDVDLGKIYFDGRNFSKMSMDEMKHIRQELGMLFQGGDNIAFINEGKLWWEGDRNSIMTSDNKELNDFVFATELTRKLRKF